MKNFRSVNGSVILNQIYPLQILEEVNKKKYGKSLETFSTAYVLGIVTYLQSLCMKQIAHFEMGSS